MSSIARRTGFPRAGTPGAGDSNAGRFGRSDSRERDVAQSSTSSTGTVVFVMFLIIAASERHLYTRFRLSGHTFETRATSSLPIVAQSSWEDSCAEACFQSEPPHAG